MGMSLNTYKTNKNSGGWIVSLGGESFSPTPNIWTTGLWVMGPAGTPGYPTPL